MQKEYYILPTDSYGQPDGNIETIKLTKKEYLERKNRGEYIYNNYTMAVIRAYD